MPSIPTAWASRTRSDVFAARLNRRAIGGALRGSTPWGAAAFFHWAPCFAVQEHGARRPCAAACPAPPLPPQPAPQRRMPRPQDRAACTALRRALQAGRPRLPAPGPNKPRCRWAAAHEAVEIATTSTAVLQARTRQGLKISFCDGHFPKMRHFAPGAGGPAAQAPSAWLALARGLRSTGTHSIQTPPPVSLPRAVAIRLARVAIDLTRAGLLHIVGAPSNTRHNPPEAGLRAPLFPLPERNA